MAKSRLRTIKVRPDGVMITPHLHDAVLVRADLGFASTGLVFHGVHLERPVELLVSDCAVVDLVGFFPSAVDGEGSTGNIALEVSVNRVCLPCTADDLIGFDGESQGTVTDALHRLESLLILRIVPTLGASLIAACQSLRWRYSD